ncbi:MAG: RNB domain-containing ribonuclease, partial [bacterium]
VYRVHEPPDEDKIAELGELLSAMGYHLGPAARRSPAPFQEILRSVRGTAKERFLNTVILRSMKKAIYSQHPEGHFALALKDYAHFTSPIRRYADLLVHRAMKGILGLDRPFDVKDLEEVCSHISTSEQNAEKAQRDILALMRARFMAGRVGETFSGIVSGITSFGFFVELEEYFVEGLVRLSSLFDDFYHFREKDLLLLGENTGRIIRIGDSVTVKVVRVDTSMRHIDFEVVDE